MTLPPANSAKDAPPVVLAGVTKSFGGNAVLRGLDLRVERGETVAVLGPSGTGKSVLLKILVGLLDPDAGSVELWGRPVVGISESEWRPIRQRIGLVFQSGALFDSMTVAENVAFPLVEGGERDGEKIAERVAEVLDWVKLSGAEDKSPSDLSGGMRKRVALARTLSVHPELILYDEPTTGLDPATGRRISELIRDLGARVGSTAIVVTHDIDCASTVAERWVFLHDGRILADGSAEELFATRLEALAEFLSPWLALRSRPVREVKSSRARSEVEE